MADPLRIFAISHSCVVAAYRERFRRLAMEAISRQAPDLAITLLTPARWWQFNELLHSPPAPADAPYTLIRRQPLAIARLPHGLRNATHLYRGLRRMLADARPAVIEIWEEPFFAVTWQAIRAARRLRLGAKVLFFSAQNVRKRRPFLFRWIERYVFAQADGCFAMNAEIPIVLGEKGWHGPSTVLPLGIDPDEFPPAPSSGVERKAAPVVGYLGKLDEQKGIPDLLAALDRLHAGGASFEARFIGAGPLAEETARHVRAAAWRGEVLPAIPRESVPRTLAAMDLVVMPSRTMPGLKEQFGRVAVEAMAMGKTVVVSDSGELPNVVGSAGIVTPERNPTALAAAMAELLADPARREGIGELARARATREFSWAAIAKKHLDFYLALGILPG